MHIYFFGTYIGLEINSKVVSQFPDMSSGVKISKDHQIVSSLIEELSKIVNIQSNCNFVLYPTKLVNTRWTYL